ncbi:MAG TPA: DUF11 domain-containing protein [Thermoplasmatales archaeon]|nr:DUF11 domain-containing protein [Thermoplasmatales archaeon]
MKYNRLMSMICVVVLVLSSFGGIYYWKGSIKANAQLPPINNGFELWQWEQVSDEGFGDLTNDYAWSMAVYSPPGSGKEYLYVGTLNTNVTDPPLPEQGCQIWRTDGTMIDGKYVWEQVVGPAAGNQAPAGFMGVGQHCFNPLDPNYDLSFAFGVRGMTVYNGLLWVGTMPFAEIFVTDGSTWKRANLPGFGVVGGMTSTRGITVYKGKIYAEVEDMYNGVRIFRYDGPTDFDSIGTLAAQANWIQVNYPGFDNTNYNKMVGELLVFDPPDDGEDEEYLYACTWTLDADAIIIGGGDGFEIWRTNGSENPDGKLKWECVVGGNNLYGNEPGLGDDNNWAVMSAVVYNGMLYIGTLNFNDGAEIWRTRDGVTWEPVELYGFGRTNGYIWRLIEYKGMLVAGTLNPFFGCEIWASDTGEAGTFKQVNINGMDASFTLPANIGAFVGRDDGPIVYWADQYGVRSVAIYDDYLIIGTASWGDWVDRVLYPATNGKWHNLSGYVGCEIWRTDASLLTLENMKVNKTVFEPSTGEWVDNINVSYYHELKFRCTIFNNNDTMPIQNIYAVDILPPGTTYVGGASIIYPDGHREYLSPHYVINLKRYIPQLESTILIWNLSDIELPPKKSISVEYNAIVDKVYEIKILDYKFKLLNTFFAFGSFGGALMATPQIPLVWGFDWDIVSIDMSMPLLVASIVDNHDPVQVGDNLSYFVRISNEGNAPAENVTILINYDSNYVLDVANPYPDVSDNIWNLGTLNPGENFTIQLNGVVVGGEDIVANLIFSSSNGNHGSVIEETKVAYPEIGVLKLIKLTAPPSVKPGEIINYRILCYNPSDINLTNVTIIETYPKYTEFVTAYPSPTEGNNIWKIKNLPAHSGVTMMVMLGVSSPLDNGTILRNRVDVTCEEGVSAEYNVESTVISSPHLEISLDATQHMVQDDRNVTYYVTIGNTGDMNASDVTVIWHYNESFIDVISSDGGTIGNGNVTWYINKLSAGQTIIYEVNIHAKDVMEDTMMDTFAEGFCDDIYARDNCTILIKPVPVYKLGMNVIKPGCDVEPNASFNYTVMIKNEGNVQLTNITLNAMYGAGAKFVAASPLPSSGNNGWYIASLMPGETITINITMHTESFLQEGDKIETEFDLSCSEGLNEHTIISMEVVNEAPKTYFRFNGEFSIRNFLFFYTSYIIPESTTLILDPIDEPEEGAAGVKATYIAIWRWDTAKSRWICLQGWKKYNGEEIDLAKVGIENGYEAKGKYSILYYSIDNAGNREAFIWRDIIVC